MAYRDSKGRVSKNPYDFLVACKKFKTKDLPKLSEERKADLLFEMEWAKKESKILGEKALLIKYLPYFIEYHKTFIINIKNIEFIPRISRYYGVDYDTQIIIDKQTNISKIIESFYLEVLNKYVSIVTINNKIFTISKNRYPWLFYE